MSRAEMLMAMLAVTAVTTTTDMAIKDIDSTSRAAYLKLKSNQLLFLMTYLTLKQISSFKLV